MGNLTINGHVTRGYMVMDPIQKPKPQGTQGILTPAWSACGLRWWRFHGWWSTGTTGLGRWMLKNPPEISRNLGKLPVVFFGFLWWFCGGYTCEKSFSHRKRWKHQLIFATRLLWFCDVTFRLALVLEAKMGDSCWCVSCCRVRGASGASSDTNATNATSTRGFTPSI